MSLALRRSTIFKSMAVAAESFLCLCDSRSKARMKGLSFLYMSSMEFIRTERLKIRLTSALTGTPIISTSFSASMKATTSRKWRAVK